ncbi:metallophosphoesterase 1 homolog isoform X2 [Pieris brassicae]|uniref:metallophosphoesterase 1 homolog isoform X2 n=1 Tax=Pieris brassicae TaxID=7116 RepID=UPI001E6606C1|nr:metallophosphoesterase 1 homolog isoform X2 [Pieris brassicae]
MRSICKRRLFLCFNKIFPQFLVGLFFIYVYCEYLIYYVTQLQCRWPTVEKNVMKNDKPVYAMVLADIHLLGSKNGHWLDKERREWQMHRAFQTAMTLHNPELVFILGDIFDEGKWSSQKEFNEYVERFKKLFEIPKGTTLHVVAGNHDIGFHYKITPQLANRFEVELHAPPVKLISIRGNHFILINSMAMEGDGCRLCSRAVAELEKIADTLKCSSGSTLCKGKTRVAKYSRPILMQHYPLYRESDTACTESEAPVSRNLFEERWDCLSKESTEYLIESLLPRAAFGAHTHNSCLIRHSLVPRPEHKIEFVEYTVPSFSWRNRLDPKYYLLSVTPYEVKVAKCELTREVTIQVTAVLLIIALVVYIQYYNTRSYSHLSDKQV